MEEREHHVARLDWGPVAGHGHGFRTSPGFGGFFAAVRRFFGRIREMKHCAVRAAGSAD